MLVAQLIKKFSATCTKQRFVNFCLLSWIQQRSKYSQSPLLL